MAAVRHSRLALKRAKHALTLTEDFEDLVKSARLSGELSELN